VLRFEQIAVEREAAASQPPWPQSYVANGNTLACSALPRLQSSSNLFAVMFASRAVATLHTFVCVMVINGEPTTHQAKRAMRNSLSLKVLTQSIGPGSPCQLWQALSSGVPAQ
jgi:hypothetical protein